ncbi:Hypothetical predicted protein [Mytilus galloprovincialis]|uniref:TTF-type domain-containing protein n=1 Tax=Mytilus galloprovincialis TaxID=29158 RepID=A0A8B6D6R6_MYTGA|nr:Hypothetical predicted protein [Mytilus galloprovincialis]
MSLQNWLKTGSLKRKKDEKDDHSDTEKLTPDISSPIQNEPDPEIRETPEPSTSKKSTLMSVSSQKGLDPAIFLIENQHSTDEQKLAMLKDADEISNVYPKKGGRRYLPSWESQFPWLRYSCTEDAAYCKYCVVFRDEGGLFSSKGFTDWKNAVGNKRSTLKSHDDSVDHRNAVEKAENFISVCEGKKPSICSSLSKAYEDKVKKNHDILLSIIDVIIVLGQRNIALRGNWDKISHQEDGNFQFFINWKSNFDTVLKDHLETAHKSMTNLSPQIQNELIQCCELEIRERIVQKCKASGFYSIMADETTDVSVTEQLSLCIRYVDNDTYEVREDFLGFVEPKEVDAEHIANAIVSNLDKWGLPLQKLRGQGYDGASVMSGHVSGVQQRIREQCPDAPFVHCKSHNLNLVVTQSCKDVRQIRNLMSSVGQMTWFLCASHKRKTILNSFTGNTKLVDDMLEGLQNEEEDVDIKLLKKGTDVSVKRLCETRWTARVDTVSSLLANYKSVHAALTKIENVSTSDARTNASGYRRYLEDPECIVAVLVAQFVLSILKPLTLFLQKTDCNMVDAFEESKILLELLQEKRTEEIFSELFRRGTVIADAIEIDLMPRRRVGRQVHRENAATASTAEQHWRINLFFPFLDHVISEMQRRFPDEVKNQMLGYYLIPKNVGKLTPELIEHLFQAFPDVTNMEELTCELERWVRKTVGMLDEGSLTTAIKLANKDLYPNVFTILQVLLTMPVTSVCCERSFSSLRRLKTWERATMGATCSMCIGIMQWTKNVY